MTNRFGGDIFRDRMVIALQDSTGAPVGFTGRILREVENAPKYLNTPQTLLYDKSSNVFGLPQAKNEIRKAGFAVVVEGNMDVISSHQAGVKNVVACVVIKQNVND
jgi:DNA primase